MTLKATKNVQLLVLLLLQTPSTAAHVPSLFTAEDELLVCEFKVNLRDPAFAS